MNEHTRSIDPRTKHIRVGRLCPAGVRDVPVNVRVAQVHPVASGDAVTETVAGTRQLGHFGLTGRSACKEHLHHVRTKRTSRLYVHHTHTPRSTALPSTCTFYSKERARTTPFLQL